jgi:hypothetical protein
MDPISQAAGGNAATDTAATDPTAIAMTQADFQQAFDRALVSAGTGVVSLALEDLIQISQEEI